MYGKLFESTFTGSMVGSGAATFAVWAYVLAHQRNGSVELNATIIGTVIGMAPGDVAATIDGLCAPDPRSRNKAHDGRRLIQEGEYLYTVTGYPAYSKIQDENARREYFKVKKRESRARVKESKTVKDKSTKSNVSTHSEADSDAEAGVDSSSMSTSQTNLAPPPKPAAAPRRPASPDPTEILIEDVDEDLRPFPRWWKIDAVHPFQRRAQSSFVKRFPKLSEALSAAYPTVDAASAMARAYVWEEANREKTPKGRSRFLRTWFETTANDQRGGIHRSSLMSAARPYSNGVSRNELS